MARACCASTSTTRLVSSACNDVRVDTYCKRQAIRDKYKGQIAEATFNGALADGEGLESALADAMADFEAEHKHQKEPFS